MRPMISALFAALLAFVAGCSPMMPAAPAAVASATARDWMLVANDEKIVWDDAGKPVLSPAGRDTVSIVDIGSDPLSPSIIANLALPNTIVGPPTNLAITPDGTLALVANSMNMVRDDAGALKNVPDDRLFVIDLTTRPPQPIDTVHVGRQPSGLSINRAGTLALVANRADNSISVLRILGRRVEAIDTVPLGPAGGQVAHVCFTPDGRHALAVKFAAHKVALLDVEREKVSYRNVDLPTGLWPYNVDVTPDGRLALVADNGNAGAADGSVDTVSVIDLQPNPPRMIDKIVVGDAPEGFAISPNGKIAVAVLLRGSNSAKNAPFYHRNGNVVALEIDGSRVTRGNEVEVGSLPEGAVFSADGRYLYVGNFLDRNVSILEVSGNRLVDTGRKLDLPGHPAAMRGRTMN